MAPVKDPPLQRCRAGVPAPCLHRAGTQVWPGSGFPTMTARPSGAGTLGGAGSHQASQLGGPGLVQPSGGEGGNQGGMLGPECNTRVVETRRSPWKLRLPQPHPASGKGPARAHVLSPACVCACTAPRACPRTRVQTQWLKGQAARQPTLYC